jgi:hypothetical protein
MGRGIAAIVLAALVPVVLDTVLVEMTAPAADDRA